MLPPRVERIVFNNLIRPRFIPNLMPSPDHENDFPGDNYFFSYGPRIGSTQQNISNAQLKDFDELIADVNRQSRDILKTALGPRVVFADILPMLCSLHWAGRSAPTRPPLTPPTRCSMISGGCLFSSPRRN